MQGQRSGVSYPLSGGRKLVITPDGTNERPRPRTDSALVKALARAHRWQRMLESGRFASIAKLAAAEKIDRPYLCRMLRLALLAPEIIEAIFGGSQPEEITLDKLLKPLPSGPVEQEMKSQRRSGICGETLFSPGADMGRDESFLARVRGSLADLHPAERRVGELVCDFPGELASYSAKELAALAGVSNATVTRFVRRLGYESYEEARRHARQESETGSRLYLPAETAGWPSDATARQVDQSVANLTRTLSAIEPNVLEAIAKALLTARKVWVIGFRASHAFTSYLHWQLTQAIENIVAIPGGGQTLGEHLVNVTSADCVVFFGLRRRVAITDRILAEVEARGARLLYISDEGIPERSTAEWHVRCETASSGAMFNHVAVMGVCHLIANRVIELAGAEGRARLRRIEALNDALEEL